MDNLENKVERKLIYDYVMSKVDTTKEMVFRKGEAPKLLDEVKPDKIEITGTITAPSEFFKKRKKDHDMQSTHVTFDKNAGKIVLTFDERYGKQNFVITGLIKSNPDLDDFCINGKKTFTVKELMEKIKFNRIFFEDKDVHAKIVTSLMQFKAKAEQTITDISNNRGVDEISKLSKLEHSLEESFILVIPVYKGSNDSKFKVDICVTAKSSTVEIWLESAELKEIQDSMIDTMIDTELENFSDIVCIEQ